MIEESDTAPGSWEEFRTQVFTEQPEGSHGDEPDEVPGDGAPDADSPAEEEPTAEAVDEPAPEPEGTAEDRAEVTGEADAEPAPEEPEDTVPPDDGQPETGEDEPEHPELERFTPRVDGTDIQIDSAARTADGWIIMREEDFEKQLRPYLGDRSAWRNQAQDYERRIRDAERKASTPSQAEIEAQALVDELHSVFEKGPEAVYDWLQDFDKNRPALEARVELAVLKRQKEAREAQEKETSDRDAEARLKAWIPQAIDAQVANILGLDAYKDLGLDAKEIAADLKRWGRDMVFQAEEDIPQWGVRKGQHALRVDRVLGDIDARARLVRRERQKQAEAERAAEENRRKTKPQRKVPPTVTAQGTPSGEKKTVELGDDATFEDFREKVMRS